MSVRIEELTSDLNKLLYDICTFFTNEANYKQLSPSARKQADELINRSKHQLQEIAKITTEYEYGGAYVDMEQKSATSSEDDKNNIYSCVDDILTPPKPVKETVLNPYANLPAKKLPENIKCGFLSWKCKFILNFEKVRRIYAAIHDNWLLIYSNEKDCKPRQTFYLKYHKAQNVQSKQDNTKDFELISTTAGEKKSYYFIALTHKDMLQWITHINKYYDSLNEFFEVSDNSEVSETYDVIGDSHNKTAEGDNEEQTCYQDIMFPEVQDNKLNKPPELPSRISAKSNTPLPPVPNTAKSEEDLSESSSIYDVVQSPQLNENSEDSFSEEDADDIYDAVVTKTTEKNILPKNQSNESNNTFKEKDIFLNKEKPKTPVKPLSLKARPIRINSIKK